MNGKENRHDTAWRGDQEPPCSVPPQDTLLKAALRYAELGYRVFPARPNGKKPAIKDNLKSATDNEDVIRGWWYCWQHANVAIVTEGLCVVDVDRGSTWEQGLTPEQRLELGDAPLVQTPNGAHYYFRAPPDVDVRCSVGKLAPHTDIRGRGGYVIAPPSVVDGKPYRWIQGRPLCSPNEVPVAPALVIEAIKKRNARTTHPTGTEVIPAGRRNSTLTSLAGRMRRAGSPKLELELALSAMNETRCRPPLPPAEVSRIAGSIAKYPEGSGENSHWPDPQPSNVEAELPILDIDNLFRGLPAARELVRGIERAVQTRPGPAALAVLVGCSGETGPKFREVWRGSEHPISLFGLVCQVSGAGKTPSARIPFDSLTAWHDRQRRENALEIAAWKAARDEIEGEIQGLKNTMKASRKPKPKGPSRADLTKKLKHAYMRRDQLGSEPYPDRFLTNTTFERLIDRMAQDGSIVLYDQEAQILKIACGFYTGGRTQFGPLNKSWSGERFQVARKGADGKGSDVVVTRPILSAFFATHPSVLRRLGSKCGEDLIEEGLAARILPCLAPVLKRKKSKQEDDISTEDTASYSAWIETLAKIPARLNGAPWLLRFSKDADELLRGVETWASWKIEEEPWARSWLSKTIDHVGRVAGNLTVMKNPSASDLTIEAGTVETAAAVVKGYFWPHARAFLRILGQKPGLGKTTCLGEVILRWLPHWKDLAGKGGFEPTTVTVRNLKQYGPKTLRSEEAADLDRAMTLLDAEGYLRASEKLNNRRRPSFYWIHPRLAEFAM